jgi:SAM-dependent methyltransferase
MAGKRIRELWRAGELREALALAWECHDAAPDARESTYHVARLLRDEPQLLTAERAEGVRRLLVDPHVDPAAISAAAWLYLLRDGGIFSGDMAAMAAATERNALALTLLREDYVANLDVEQTLTQLRRWLLLERRWPDFPALADALIAQAALNDGAWLFDADERARFDDGFTLAYLPRRPQAEDAGAFGHAVTRAVAAQYEGWPYPAWRRVLMAPPTTLADEVARRDPGGPPIPTPADILIAGCGTGRQTALTASRLPQERIASIDISEASLAYARARCAALGLNDIGFQTLDLHEVEKLGRQFDAIMCAGVLHHLPDPEKGWEALVRVLKPGGVMHVMVYSRVARMRVTAWRRTLTDLADRPVDDDLLREVRRRILAMPSATRPRSRDFHTLGGVHDLLMHRHEDPFDIPRIRRALDRLGLALIRFELPNTKCRADYVAAHPDDPLRRDFDGWMRQELNRPTTFAGMYDFWCRKAPA